MEFLTRSPRVFITLHSYMNAFQDIDLFPFSIQKVEK
jgi:hypothetical protein